jgi:hypothetical protein
LPLPRFLIVFGASLAGFFGGAGNFTAGDSESLFTGVLDSLTAGVFVSFGIGI